MQQYLLIALGGAAGALSRFAVSRYTANFLNINHWPVGTFAVNLVGSLVIGMMYVLITEKSSLHPDWRYVLMVGFLGAFTTFSTFSLETVAMLEAGRVLLALSYVVATLFSCIFGCWLGVILLR